MGRLFAAFLLAGALALASGGAGAAPPAKPAAKAAPAKKAPARKAPAKKAPAPKVAPEPEAPEETPAMLEQRWQGAAGVESAGVALSRCLEGPRPESCAHAAFLLCEREYGARSQQSLADCAAHSRAAWDARLDGVMGRLQALMEKTGRTKPSPRSLASSQKRWRSWSEADCTMQTEASKGGALRPMEMDLCHSDHAFPRAQELEQLERIWGR